MSTAPEETPEETNPDAEPVEPIEGDDADAEEEEESQTPAEAAAAEGSADTAKKLQAATKAYHTRVANLLGQEMEGFICQKCDGFGFADTPLLITDEFETDDTKTACPKCKGKGQLISHSLAPGHELVMCITCSGQGWVTAQQPQENVYTFNPQPITAQAAQMGTMLPDGTFVPFAANASTQNPTYNPA